MALEWLSRLAGTMQSKFGIGGTSGINIKHSSGAAQVRNAADSAYAPIGVSSLQLKDGGSANQVVIQSPSLAGNLTETWPADNGSPGYVLANDGSGVLSWVASSSNGDLEAVEPFTQATSSPLTVMTPPANSVIKEIRVIVDVAAGGGAPTIEIGIAGTIDRYMTAAENDLKSVNSYETNPMYVEDVSPDNIIATITPDSQTFSGRIYVRYGNPA